MMSKLYITSVMKIYQVYNQFGDEVGLFETSRDDDHVISDIEKCFEMALEICKKDRTIDFMDAAETYLEDRGIYRIYVTNVYVKV